MEGGSEGEGWREAVKEKVEGGSEGEGWRESVKEEVGESVKEKGGGRQ